MEFEKRKNPRFACLNTQDYPIDFKDKGLKAYLCDLSRTGISFQSSKPFETDKTCRFEVWVSALERPVSCEACIMWSTYEVNTDRYLSGARIVQMDPSSKIDLLDILYQDWKQKTVSSLL